MTDEQSGAPVSWNVVVMVTGRSRSMGLSTGFTDFPVHRSCILSNAFKKEKNLQYTNPLVREQALSLYTLFCALMIAFTRKDKKKTL